MSQSLSRITWVDSGMHLDHGWAPTDVYKRSANKWHGQVVTTGEVFYEDHMVVVVGLSKDTAGDNWFGAQLIYKPCILTWEYLDATGMRDVQQTVPAPE